MVTDHLCEVVSHATHRFQSHCPLRRPIQHIVGIDVGTETCPVSILRPDRTAVRSPFTISNAASGFARLASTLTQLTCPFGADLCRNGSHWPLLLLSQSFWPQLPHAIGVALSRRPRSNLLSAACRCSEVSVSRCRAEIEVIIQSLLHRARRIEPRLSSELLIGRHTLSPARERITMLAYRNASLHHSSGTTWSASGGASSLVDVV